MAAAAYEVSSRKKCEAGSDNLYSIGGPSRVSQVAGGPIVGTDMIHRSSKNPRRQMLECSSVVESLTPTPRRFSHWYYAIWECNMAFSSSGYEGSSG
jgi:hypothetical protein